jgi:hypothetical protein
MFYAKPARFPHGSSFGAKLDANPSLSPEIIVTFKAKVLCDNLALCDNVTVEIEQRNADNWKGSIQTLASLEVGSQYRLQLDDGRSGIIRIQSTKENGFVFASNSALK